MANPYGSDSTPDLDELLQNDDPVGLIRVPVRVVEVSEPVEVHNLPARRAVMRSVVTTAGVVQQLVGYDHRRSVLKVWADGAANGIMTLGVRKDEVEQDTAARWPVQINTGVNGVAPVLEMNHCEAVWVKTSQATAVTYIAEYWAD